MSDLDLTLSPTHYEEEVVGSDVTVFLENGQGANEP